MTFREFQYAQAMVAERPAVSYQQGSGCDAPIPASADVEYANRLGVEYFSLVAGEGQCAPDVASITAARAKNR